MSLMRPWAQRVVATVPVDDPFRVHDMRRAAAGCRAWRGAGPGLALDACRPGVAEVSGVQAGPQGRRRRRCGAAWRPEGRPRTMRGALRGMSGGEAAAAGV